MPSVAITKTVFIAAATLVFAGCLQTRANLRQESPTYTAPTKAPSHSPEQTKQAEAVAKNEDVNNEFRQLYGRIETVESQLKESKENEYVKGLETKLQQMEAKMTLLETTVAELNAKAKAAPAAVPAYEPPKQMGIIDKADGHFLKKDWEDAILAYEEYRKKNPKGSDYAHATYRIGLSFQSMGLKDDAKAFFKEVVDKYPKSKEASLAKDKLKKL